jgi:cyclase
MLKIIPCLDVRDGQLTKGVKFKDNVDLGDPAIAARRYCEDGADEIVLYDFNASAEGRSVFLDVVEKVAAQVSIPFIVGGGISTVAQMRSAKSAGADKFSVNSAAVTNPDLLSEGAAAFGSKAIVLGMDALKVAVTAEIPSGYEIVTRGGRTHTGLDAVAWAVRAEKLGAGEICLNSIDADGTKDGYELTITRLVAEAVSIPVIASGGAGKPEHLYEALTEGKAAAALVASIVHYNEHSISDLKAYLKGRGLAMR